VFMGREFFFFAHSFKSALQHAEDFVERNKGTHEMKLYTLNESSFGERWRLSSTA
jgi:hypothetical protein